MRIKRNSNPFAKFTPKQQVMGDKAEELGFVWDRSKYPTPAWEIDLGNSTGADKYTVRFGLSTLIWDMELALWACDCAERVMPIWSNSVRAGSYNPAPEALELARSYIKGMTTGDVLTQVTSRIYSIYHDSIYHEIGHEPSSAAQEALYSIYLACASSGWYDRHVEVTDMASSCSVWASFAVSAAAREKSEHSYTIRETEYGIMKSMLANRIDSIAPWRL